MKNNKLKVKNFKPHNYKDFPLTSWFALNNWWLTFWYKKFESKQVIDSDSTFNYNFYKIRRHRLSIVMCIVIAIWLICVLMSVN